MPGFRGERTPPTKETTTAYDPTDPTKGFATAAAKFFGKRPGTNLADFAQEIKALSTQDKHDLHSGIDNGSLTY